VRAGKFAKLLLRGMFGGKQAKNIHRWRKGLILEVNFCVLKVAQAGFKSCRGLMQSNRSEATNAAKTHVKQRGKLFDQVRFQQQRANLAGRFDKVDAPSARHHAGFVWCAQVGQNPTPNVHTFANIERQSPIALKEIHPRCSGQGG